MFRLRIPPLAPYAHAQTQRWEEAMRYVRALCSLAVFAAGAFASTVTAEPLSPQGTTGQTGATRASSVQNVSADKIVTGTLACLLGPVVTESATGRTAGVGLTQAECSLATQAANV